MKITQLYYETLVNLGNYENKKIGMRAEPGEGEDPDAAMGELIDRVQRAAGKPTRAEQAAMDLLDEVGGLWSRVRSRWEQAKIERQQARRYRDDAKRYEGHAKVAPDSWEARQVPHLLENAARAEKRAPALDQEAAELLQKAEAREQEPAVIAARSLLGRPLDRPAPPTEEESQAAASDDDIPFGDDHEDEEEDDDEESDEA